MRKNPSTRWFFEDWCNDEALRACSLAAQGAWMNMLCICAENDGYLLVDGQRASCVALARYVGVHHHRMRRLLLELEHNGVFSRTPEGIIFNRRMVREKFHLLDEVNEKKHAQNRKFTHQGNNSQPSHVTLHGNIVERQQIWGSPSCAPNAPARTPTRAHPPARRKLSTSSKKDSSLPPLTPPPPQAPPTRLRDPDDHTYNPPSIAEIAQPIIDNILQTNAHSAPPGAAERRSASLAHGLGSTQWKWLVDHGLLNQADQYLAACNPITRLPPQEFIDQVQSAMEQLKVPQHA